LTILIILLAVFFILLAWLLLAPIQIIVDSAGPSLMIRVVSVGSADVYFQDGIPLLRIRGFFLSKDIRFDRFGSSSTMTDKDKTKVGKKKRKPFSRKRRKWLIRLFRIPGSFRLIKINVNVDSGDYILNAYLYPVFGQLHNLRPGWSWAVNYFGEIKLYLIIQSSLIRMIYVYFK